MSCIPYNGDPAQQRCTDEKTDVYNTTTPIINVTFQETVQVTDYRLYRVGGLADNVSTDPDDMFNISPDAVEINMAEIAPSQYQPTRHVADGIYIFRITAFNIPNINIDVAVLFRINGTNMEMWVSSPKNRHVTVDEHPDFAVSSQAKFFFELETARDIAECRFTPFGIPSTMTLGDAFSTATTEPFTTNTTDHRHAYISDFDITDYFAYNFDGELRLLYVICNETAQPSRYSYGEIYVGVDQTPPAVNAAANPNPVVDYMTRTTNITILTDDRSVCTIAKMNPPPGVTMPVFVRNSSYDADSLGDFLTDYSEQTMFSNQPNPYSYKLNITCDNLANLRTSTQYTVNVNLVVVQSFKFYSPAGLVNTSSLFINGSTTIGNSNCSASLNKTNPSSFITLTKADGYFVDGRQVFTGTLPSLPEGTNTLYVNCTYMGAGEFSTKTFKADRTAPTAPNIITSENSCSLSRINAGAESYDNTSGVKKYYYNLTLQDDPNNESYARSGSSANGQLSISIDGENILGRIYSLKAWAEDNAGNTGPYAVASIRVSNASITECDFTPPLIDIYATKDLSGNSWTVKVNCTDTGSGCQQSARYALQTNTNETCQPTQSIGLMTPIPITQTGIFCAAVYDMNSNNATEETGIIVSYPLHCYNFAKDGTETDIDCGGDCIKCALNKTCAVFSDCISNYCRNGICAEPKCNDLIRNGQETGVDCGGAVCAPCGLGGSCLLDSDCQSGNCFAGICAGANCTDNKKDGYETDVDCGGPCDKCANGKGCQSANDCQSSYCNSTAKTCEIDPALDTDRDGLPDVWELKFFNCATCADPDEDYDKDGYTNLEEYRAGTNPLDPNDHPMYHKLNMWSLLFLILGAIALLAGAALKAVDVLEEERKRRQKQEKEMTTALDQIPRMTSFQSQREYSPEELALREQNRLRSQKLKALERRKRMSQFGAGEEPAVPAEKSGAAPQKPLPAEEKRRKLDAGTKDEYVDLAELGKKDQDAFAKLREIARGKPSQKPAPQRSAPVQKAPRAKQQPKKAEEKDEVFEKLKTMTKKMKRK
jgi:hypothetical protein